MCQFSFSLSKDWELPRQMDTFRPFKEGVKDMLVKHHLFSWDLVDDCNRTSSGMFKQKGLDKRRGRCEEVSEYVATFLFWELLCSGFETAVSARRE
ncbi:small G protein signaling modulator 3 [Plakobranchus ocellatus]|uniref:Small G protein signaling modulator 3 n=1 Tax=Plakobranchus ocellatus TaxID=259542 RepID=A0AAV4B960_9GAST|nr:small G protein signaling modulator 3 [Plakobranchus ocellatus]